MRIHNGGPETAVMYISHLPSLHPAVHLGNVDLLAGVPAAILDQEVTWRLKAMLQEGKSER